MKSFKQSPSIFITLLRHSTQLQYLLSAYQEIVGSLAVMGTFFQMIDNSQGCHDLQGTRKDIKCLQSRGKKTIQGHCQHPVGPKFLLSGKQQWSPNLSPQPHFSFPPIQSTNYQVTPLETQFGSRFQKPNQYPPRLGILYFLKQGLHRGLKALSLKQTRPIPCSNMPHVSLPPCSYTVFPKLEGPTPLPPTGRKLLHAILLAFHQTQALPSLISLIPSLQHCSYWCHLQTLLLIAGKDCLFHFLISPLVPCVQATNVY